MEKYQNRQDAGSILASYLLEYKNSSHSIILALPRGGVPVAYQVAQILNLPLDVFLVRKLGFPGHEELALGALATGGTMVFNEELLNQITIDKKLIDSIIEKEQKELNRREKVYRGEKPFLELKDKNIILVDDGIATGATIKASIKALKKLQPKKIIIAVPVAALSTINEIKLLVDEVICPITPVNFIAVGKWYHDFNQTEDKEVIDLLQLQSEYMQDKMQK